MNVLVLNCGSSSLKFQIIGTDRALQAAEADRRLARGLVERIGPRARATAVAWGETPAPLEVPALDHRAALEWVLGWLFSAPAPVAEIRSPSEIHAVGHRVVHGGERFKNSVLVTPEVIREIEGCIDLAPLHNPANLEGIRAAADALGPVPQAAVFDTAFHATIPEKARVYGIPHEYTRRLRIRRYGFHGTSHRSAVLRVATLLGIPPARVNVISLHLGNGCSACAIRGGVSVDTSMGFTPLEGLLMGTRAGDLDASIVGYLQEKEGLTTAQVDTVLNEQSGLLGVSGLSSDMRDLLAAEMRDPRARLAVDLFCYRVAKVVGAYVAALRGADAVVFTGGIGENSPAIRERICEGLEVLGLRLDAARNAAMTGGRSGGINMDVSPMKAFVVPADEELLIARDTHDLVVR